MQSSVNHPSAKVKAMNSVLYLDDDSAFPDPGKIFLERTGFFSATTIDPASAALALLKTGPFCCHHLRLPDAGHGRTARDYGAEGAWRMNTDTNDMHGCKP